MYYFNEPKVPESFLRYKPSKKVLRSILYEALASSENKSAPAKDCIDLFEYLRLGSYWNMIASESEIQGYIKVITHGDKDNPYQWCEVKLTPKGEDFIKGNYND